MAIAVNCLVIEAMRKRVSAVFGTPLASSAIPTPPSYRTISFFASSAEPLKSTARMRSMPAATSMDAMGVGVTAEPEADEDAGAVDGSAVAGVMELAGTPAAWHPASRSEMSRMADRLITATPPGCVVRGPGSGPATS